MRGAGRLIAAPLRIGIGREAGCLPMLLPGGPAREMIG